MKKLVGILLVASIFLSCENEEMNPEAHSNTLESVLSEDGTGNSSGCNFVTPYNNDIDGVEYYSASSDTQPAMSSGDMQQTTQTALQQGAELLYTYKAQGTNTYYSSSQRFNCYGFAWYMAEENDVILNQENNNFKDMQCPVFIGSVEDNSHYFNEGSYVEVDSWVHPAIVHNDLHAMITTETPGIVISKWGLDGPLMRHPVNVGPWAFTLGNEGDFKYYIRNDFCSRYHSPAAYIISGPDKISCDGTATYSVANLKSNDVITWHYDHSFVKISETSSSITLKANATSTSTSGTVSATVDYHTHIDPSICAPDSRTITPKTVHLEKKPLLSYEDITFGNAFGYPANHLCKSHSGNYYQVDNSVFNATQFDVQITHLNGQIISQFTTFSTSRNINFTNLNGFYLFRMRAKNACGYGPWFETEFEYRDCSVGGGGGGSSSETGDW